MDKGNLRYSEDGKELLKCLNKDKSHYDIQNGTEVIHDSVFADCENLETITIPLSVEQIGQSAFRGCKKLSSLKTLSSPLTKEIRFFPYVDEEFILGDSAFEGCENLKQITFPYCITKIGCRAFAGCVSLDDFHMPMNVREIGHLAFKGCKKLPSVTIPQKVTTIGRSAFSDCTGLKSVTIESYLAIVGYDAFRGCTGLTSIVPNEIKGSLTNSCQDAEMTDSVTIPNCVNRIHSYAFHACTGLASVILSDNITEIERGAFRGCAGLRLLVIGVGLTMVEDMAFMDCTNMNEIRINAVDPPKCDANAFSGVPPENIRLFVPRGSRDAYSKADVWKDFTIREFDYPINNNWYPLDMEDME